MEILKGLFGEQVSELSEDQIKAIGDKVDALVEARADAKVKFQIEIAEAEAKEKYDGLLKESTDKFAKDLTTLEEEAITKAKAFKEKLETAHGATSTKLTEDKASEIDTFKTELVEKVNKYLKYELEKKIPDTFVEAVAKVQVLEPIVEGFKQVMSENYIKIDEENFGLLKDAHGEIVKIREELAESVKENMEINSELQDYRRSMKISQVCEGLTEAQRERASKLLESYGVEEIEERYGVIRDIIIEGNEKEEEEEVEEAKEEGDEEEVKEGEEESNAPADKGGQKIEEEEVEGEEDVMSVPESTEPELVPESADTEALKDDQRLIESWADRFREISKR